MDEVHELGGALLSHKNLRIIPKEIFLLGIGGLCPNSSYRISATALIER